MPPRDRESNVNDAKSVSTGLAPDPQLNSLREHS